MKTNRNIIIAVVAALLVVSGWLAHSLADGNDVIPGISSGPELRGATAVTELALQPDEDQALVNENGPYVMGAIPISIGGNAGTSTFAWQNRSGHDVWVAAEWAVVPTNGRGTASSTGFFEVATSSDQTVAIRSFFDKSSIVVRTVIATGTGPMYRSSLSDTRIIATS